MKAQNLLRPEPTDARNYMWDERGQETYRADWWKPKLQLVVQHPLPLPPGISPLDYQFEAIASGIPPTLVAARLSWDYGEGDGPVQGESFGDFSAVQVVSIAVHTFRNAGPHAITVILSDATGATPVELARATRKILVLGPEPSDGSAHGSWVLAATVHAGGPDSMSYDRPGEKMVVESTNGRITATYDYSVSGDQAAHQEGMVTWDTPPGSAPIGALWTSTLAATVTCTGDTNRLEDVGLGVNAPGIEGSSGVRATCEHGSGSVDLSWAFPDPTAITARTLEISASGGGAGRDTWTYRYDWRP